MWTGAVAYNSILSWPFNLKIIYPILFFQLSYPLVNGGVHLRVLRGNNSAIPLHRNQCMNRGNHLTLPENLPCVSYTPCMVSNDLYASCQLTVSLGPVNLLFTNPQAKCSFPVTSISQQECSPAILRPLLWIKVLCLYICPCVTNILFLLYPRASDPCYLILQQDFSTSMLALVWTDLSCMRVPVLLPFKSQQNTCNFTRKSAK